MTMNTNIESTMNFNPIDYIEELEYLISEVVVASSEQTIDGETSRNIFQQPIIVDNNPNIRFSYAIGAALTGLRTSLHLNNTQLLENLPLIQSAVNRHLSLVIHASCQETKCNKGEGGTSHWALKTLSESGCVQLFATSQKQALDFTIIAHKISELTLTPVIVAFDGIIEETVFRQYGKNQMDLVIRFMGSPGDKIVCNTPSQKITFGETRRRLPNWLSFDQPSMNNAHKNARDNSIEKAANKTFFENHINQQINEILKEFNQTFNTDYTWLNQYRVESADYVLLVTGQIYRALQANLDQIRSRQNIKVGCMAISIYRPFPEEAIKEALTGKKVITILEQIPQSNLKGVATNGDLFKALQSLIEPVIFKKNLFSKKIAPGKNLKVYKGLYANSNDLNDALIAKCIENMLDKAGKPEFFLNIDFVREQTDYPKQEFFWQQLTRGYPDIKSNTISDGGEIDSINDLNNLTSNDLPIPVRNTSDLGVPYAKVSNFFDHTGYFYHSSQEKKITAGPFSAINALPALSASCYPNRAIVEHIPGFIPEKCSACGLCFLSCPHSAMPPLVIQLEKIITTAIELVQGQGIGITQLVPMVKNLSKIAHKVLMEKELIGKIADILPEAFDKLIAQMKLEDEKKKAAGEDLEIIMKMIGDLPIVISEAFFKERELKQKGSGYLLLLNFDLHTCIGCGICADVCPDEAIEMVALSEKNTDQMKSYYQFWEKLPDTPAEIINDMTDHPTFNPMAAVFLSRNFYYSTLGGDIDENSVIKKILVHCISAINEGIRQPIIADLVNRIQANMSEIKNNIHSQLVAALPKEDFSNLYQSIEKEQNNQMTFDKLIAKLGLVSTSLKIDIGRIKQRCELLDALSHLVWVLKTGPSGGGRSRMAATVSGCDSMLWASQHPFNCFSYPVVVQQGEKLFELNKGMIEGQISYFLQNIRLLRWMEMERSGTSLPGNNISEIDIKGWQDLTDTEKELFPSFYVFCDQEALIENGYGTLSDVIDSEFPFKLIIFSSIGNKAVKSPYSFVKNNYQALKMGLSLGNSYFFQSMLFRSRHLYKGLVKGLRSQKPAVFHLFAPGNEKDLINEIKNQGQDLLNARVFPLVEFDLNQSESRFTALNINDNPQVESDWGHDQERGKDDHQRDPVTFAHWAYHWKPFAAHFSEETTSQEGPFVEIPDAEGDNIKCKASKEIIKAGDLVQDQWTYLRQFSGILNPFAAQSRSKVKQSLEAEYQDKLSAIKKEYEEKMAVQEAEFLRKTAQKLKGKLLKLTGNA